MTANIAAQGPAERLEADVAIVGAGIVGGLMAYRLASAGLKVIVLDSGPVIDRVDAVRRFHDIPWGSVNAAYKTEPYAPCPPDDNPSAFYGQTIPNGTPPTEQMAFGALYLRGVGGTSWHFTGHAERMQINDFRMASAYGRGVDWPISYAELEPFYEEVEREWGVAGAIGQTIAPPRSSGYPLPPVPISYMDRSVRSAAESLKWQVLGYPHARNSLPYDGRPQCCGNSSCHFICPIGAKYDGSVHVEKARQAGAQVLASRVVFDVVRKADGSAIDHLRYKLGETGGEGRIFARQFIIAAHAVETAKLLLMADGGRGVANSSGQVGRNLLTNVDNDVSGYAPFPVWPYRGPVSATGGITGLRDGAFRSEHAAAATFIVNSGSNGDYHGPTDEVNNALKQGLIGKKLSQRIHDRTARQVHLNSAIEVLPNPDNTIRPDWTRLDAKLGLPLPKVDFRIDDYTLAGWRKVWKRDYDVLKAMGATELTPSPYAKDAAASLPSGDAALVGGTARMGTDPSSSVVDTYGRSHDHPNLFIVGTSNYCTMSITSPSLTAAALAVRSARHILETRGRG